MNAKQIARTREIYERRDCGHCNRLKAAVSWWCSNEEIIKLRGTSIPGICHCPGWKPDKEYIRKQMKTEKL